MRNKEWKGPNQTGISFSKTEQAIFITSILRLSRNQCIGNVNAGGKKNACLEGLPWVMCRNLNSNENALYILYPIQTGFRVIHTLISKRNNSRLRKRDCHGPTRTLSISIEHEKQRYANNRKDSWGGPAHKQTNDETRGSWQSWNVLSQRETAEACAGGPLTEIKDRKERTQFNSEKRQESPRSYLKIICRWKSGMGLQVCGKVVVIYWVLNTGTSTCVSPGAIEKDKGSGVNNLRMWSERIAMPRKEMCEWK